MSKKRHRDRRGQDEVQNNNPLGLNPQLLDMIGANNIDMSKISAIMAAMNQDGFDINTIGSLLGGQGLNLPGMGGMGSGQNNQNNNFNGFPNMNNDMASIASMINNMDRNGKGFGNNQNMNNSNMNNSRQNNFNNNGNINSVSDENIEMLLTVKSVVNQEKARFLDKVIEMYKNGEIKY